MKKPPSTPAAILNVEEAMVHVQRAQNELDRAAQLLSPIRYGSDLMDKTFALRERVHKLWYLLNFATTDRQGMSLDNEPEAQTPNQESR